MDVGRLGVWYFLDGMPAPAAPVALIETFPDRSRIWFGSPRSRSSRSCLYSQTRLTLSQSSLSSRRRDRWPRSVPRRPVSPDIFRDRFRISSGSRRSKNSRFRLCSRTRRRTSPPSLSFRRQDRRRRLGRRWAAWHVRGRSFEYPFQRQTGRGPALSASSDK